MSYSLNKVELIGNLGNDPELRYTGSGSPVTNFRMATNERFKGRDGSQQERTEWHRVTVWGKLAETVAEYLSKGSKVHVEGQLRTKQWTDSEGIKRYSTEIVARRVGFLDSKRQGAASTQTVEVSEEDEALLTQGVGESDPAF